MVVTSGTAADVATLAVFVRIDTGADRFVLRVIRRLSGVVVAPFSDIFR